MEFRKAFMGFLVFALWACGLILFFAGYIMGYWQNAVGGLFLIVVGMFANDLSIKQFGVTDHKKVSGDALDRFDKY
jgi:hypothetical protein